MRGVGASARLEIEEWDALEKLLVAEPPARPHLDELGRARVVLALVAFCARRRVLVGGALLALAPPLVLVALDLEPHLLVDGPELIVVPRALRLVVADALGWARVLVVRAVQDLDEWRELRAPALVEVLEGEDEVAHEGVEGGWGSFGEEGEEEAGERLEAGLCGRGGRVS